MDTTENGNADVKEFFLTFGQRYHLETHPSGLNVHPDGYFIIEAISYDEARDVVIARFGTGWSNLLGSDTFEASYYSKGCLGRFKRHVGFVDG